MVVSGDPGKGDTHGELLGGFLPIGGFLRSEKETVDMRRGGTGRGSDAGSFGPFEGELLKMEFLGLAFWGNTSSLCDPCVVVLRNKALIRVDVDRLPLGVEVFSSDGGVTWRVLPVV